MISDKKTAEKLQRFCAYRERSIKEVKDKLTALHVAPQEHALYIKMLQSQKFLDEKRFVSAFINDKFKINRWGRIKIRQLLLAYHVDEALIEKGFEKIDEAEYLKTLQQIINRYKPKTKGLDTYKAQQKILTHCYSKGFEPELVRMLLQKND